MRDETSKKWKKSMQAMPGSCGRKDWLNVHAGGRYTIKQQIPASTFNSQQGSLLFSLIGLQQDESPCCIETAPELFISSNESMQGEVNMAKINTSKTETPVLLCIYVRLH